MRVALVAPPWHPVPAVGYGAVERMIAVLAEDLHRRSHQVVVYCQEGSAVAVPTRPLFPANWAVDLHSGYLSQRLLTYQVRVFCDLRRYEVDIVHLFGNPEMASAATMGFACPVVATIQHPLSPAQIDLLRAIEDRVHLVSIGPTHRASSPDVRWAGTILGTIDESSLSWPDAKRYYLVQLARISPDKGQELSVNVARRLGVPLVLGGFVSSGNQEYFEEKIKPWIGDGVEWHADIRGEQRAQVLSEARAMLFPIRWDEPFGTAMAEAMASGTPVVATPRAAALDVVEPGVTGFFADTEDEFVEAVRATEQINPIACAQRARERFGGDRFAVEYEALYQRLLGKKA
jgi:hypothetical protein